MKNHLQAVERLYKEQETEKGEGYVRDLYHMLNTWERNTIPLTGC